jgi:hypothetical protein
MAGMLVIPSTSSSVGKVTIDHQGNLCAEYSQVISNLPVDATPPRVRATNVAAKTPFNVPNQRIHRLMILYLDIAPE